VTKDIVTENEIGTVIVDSAIAVHRKLGPGLLETVYEAILAHVLHERGLAIVRQAPVPITYQGIAFDEGFRADMIVEDLVVLELKSVERLAPVHAKQVQTYLRLTGHRLGYLLNFGQALMKDGIVRCVNGLPEERQTNPPPAKAQKRREPRRSSMGLGKTLCMGCRHNFLGAFAALRERRSRCKQRSLTENAHGSACAFSMQNTPQPSLPPRRRAAERPQDLNRVENLPF